MHLFVTDMCAQTQYLFCFYLRQIPLLFILVSSQLIYFYDPLFLQFFFCFLKKNQEILSISSVYLYRVYYTAYSSGYYVIMVMMIIFFFLLRGGKRRRKNEF